MKGSAIAQAKSLQRKQKKYGDSFAQAQLDRLSVTGFPMKDPSDAEDGAGPTLSASIFWAMVVASTIVGYSLVDAVGTTLCPTPLYLLWNILVKMEKKIRFSGSAQVS